MSEKEMIADVTDTLNNMDEAFEFEDMETFHKLAEEMHEKGHTNWLFDMAMEKRRLQERVEDLEDTMQLIRRTKQPIEV